MDNGSAAGVEVQSEEHKEMEVFHCSETRSKRSVADWASLPLELLILIVSNLAYICDYIRFRSVCTSWRTATGLRELHQQLPWLVVPCLKEGRANTLSFFSLFDNRRLCALDLPEARQYWIYGSAHGWLLMIGRPSLKSLPESSRRAACPLNPITRVMIPLPRLPNGLNLSFGIKKFVTCSHPSSPQLGRVMVAVWASKRLAFIRQGDDTWSIVKHGNAPLGDFVYFDEELYVIDAHGILFVLQEESSKLSLFKQLEPPKFSWPKAFHFLEAAGDLLLLARRSKLITVFKLRRSGNEESEWKWEWLNMGNIDMTFFRRDSSRICAVCAQGLTDYGGHRIYLAYASHSLVFAGVTALVQIIDIVPGAGVIEQPYLQVPGWRQCPPTPAALTWMVPSLN